MQRSINISTIARLMLTLYAAIFASPCAQAWNDTPILDPVTYTSRSGAYALLVDPSSPDGTGPATYRLTRRGQIVWSGQKPFTLKSAVVTDDGVAAGYATATRTATIVFLTAHGDVRSTQTIPLTYGIDDGPYPDFTKTSLSKDLTTLLVDSGMDGMYRFRVADGKQISTLPSPQVSAEEADRAYRKKIEEYRQRAKHQPAIPIAHVPLKSLTFTGSIELKASPSKRQSEVRNVGAYTPVGNNRFAVLRTTGKEPPALVVAEVTGRVVSKTSLPATLSGWKITWWLADFEWMGGTRYLIHAPRQRGGNKTVGVWWLDTQHGALQPIAGLTFTSITGITRLPAGRYLILGDQRKPNGYAREALIAYTATGKPIWQLQHDEDDNRYHDVHLLPIVVRGIAVMPDNRIAIPDDEEGIRFYSARTGAYLSQMDTQAIIGDMAQYGALHSDGAGNLYFINSNGHPQTLVTIRHGRATKIPYDFRYPNSEHIVDENGSDFYTDFRVTPSGDVWISDGQALMRLDKKGKVVQVLGDLPQGSQLRNISEVAFDVTGRAYALDGHNRTIHIIDATGRWLRKCVLGNQDRDFKLTDRFSRHSLNVSATGDVYLQGVFQSERGKIAKWADPVWVHFRPDGRRRGMTSLTSVHVTSWESAHMFHERPDLPPMHEAGYNTLGAHSSAAEHWEVSVRGGYPAYAPSSFAAGAIAKLTASGALIKEVKRQPDQNWLREIISVGTAPNGAIAVLQLDEDSVYRVSTYSPDGEPRSGFKVPYGFSGADSIAYTGNLVILGEKGGCAAFTPQGVPLWQFPTHSESCSVFVTDGGKTLAIWTGGSRVQKYRLN